MILSSLDSDPLTSEKVGGFRSFLVKICGLTLKER